MVFRILSADRIKSIVRKLNPTFVGREQDALVAALDEAADQTVEVVLDRLDPLYEHRADIQSPAGASMVGIHDKNKHFQGSTVEEALEELWSMINNERYQDKD